MRVSHGCVALAIAALAGCGADKPLPAGCRTGPAAFAKALTRAPGAVALAGGTPISTCVARATDSGPLQDVGAELTAVAQQLAPSVARSDTAALRLGYLLGAAERGARRTQGVHAELLARLANSLGIDGPPAARRAAFARGRAAGRARG